MNTNVYNDKGWKAVTTIHLGRDHYLEIKTARALNSPVVQTTANVHKKEACESPGIFFKKHIVHVDFSVRVIAVKQSATERNVHDQHMNVLGDIDDLITKAHAHYQDRLRDPVPVVADPEVQDYINRNPDAFDPV